MAAGKKSQKGEIKKYKAKSSNIKKKHTHTFPYKQRRRKKVQHCCEQYVGIYEKIKHEVVTVEDSQCSGWAKNLS